MNATKKDVLKIIHFFKRRNNLEKEIIKTNLNDKIKSPNREYIDRSLLEMAKANPVSKLNNKVRIYQNVNWLFWIFISFTSSFLFVLKELSFYRFVSVSAEIYMDVLVPLILWMAAFLVDYKMNIIQKREDEIVNKKFKKGMRLCILGFILSSALFICETIYITSHNSIGSVINHVSFRLITIIVMMGIIVFLKYFSVKALIIRPKINI